MLQVKASALSHGTFSLIPSYEEEKIRSGIECYQSFDDLMDNKLNHDMLQQAASNCTHDFHAK